ncbi:MAG: class I SAM-dependent methyltransferase [Bacteroidota bacterium]
MDTSQSPAIFQGQRAAGYDTFVQAYIPYYQSTMAKIPWLLHKLLPAVDAPILVAGCGTGAELLEISERWPDWKLEGIDPSPDMIVQARQKLSGRPHLRLMEGYVHDLPEVARYRAATLLLVLHFVPDDGAKLKLLQGLASRMLPGAPLLIMDIFGSKEELIKNLKILPLLLPPSVDQDQVEERLRILPERIQYIPEPRLQELLVESGFSPPQRFLQTAIYGGWVSIRK